MKRSELSGYFTVFMDLLKLLYLLLVLQISGDILLPISAADVGCPPVEAILPCRCSLRGKEIQIWCSHSNLPQIMDGLKAVERNIKSPIDELVLENNQLPALPGRFFGTLQIMRLMLRYNSLERVSNGWLNELENSLVEIYIVEPQLRSIPVESLNGLINMVAITIQSDELKHLPDFSGLLSLNYLNIISGALNELEPRWFRHLPKLQKIHITGSNPKGDITTHDGKLHRLEAAQFSDLISLQHLDLSHNTLNWLHLRALSRLPNLLSLSLGFNALNDIGMIGRIVKDLPNLKKLKLDRNVINIVPEGAFVDLLHLTELHLNDNRITEIQYGAFLRTPMMRTLYLHGNQIRRIHPESFLQASGSGVESVYIYSNAIDDVRIMRDLLDALPALKFLDLSDNYIMDIPYGAIRGHGTLEQLHLNNNQLRLIERDSLMAFPALRELRLRNNSLTNTLPMPFWNLPALKGLDLAQNRLRAVDAQLLSGLPALRRLDLSECSLAQIHSAAFVNNPMLETLNISQNELQTMHPATLRSLDRLFELDVSSNRLREFVPGLPPIVERVSLRDNQITQLPRIALNLPNLRMLDLSGNRLTHLPKYILEGTPQLRVLSLANNRLRVLDDTAFLGAHRLELLHLQENAIAHIDERAFLPLAELRNLNMQGNQLTTVTDNMFANNTQLEQLYMSQNAIRTLAPAAFEAQRSLEYLDLSGNVLTDISIGLSNLGQLRHVDISYNKLVRIPADVVSAWRNVEEIRLSNNMITEVRHGTFRNLPQLQYLDLSSNEIDSVEPGALQQLTELQEFVLADNKLIELKDNVFTDLPNLLASHFQYNALRYVSPESFTNAPSMVFLNLSNNNFHNMENIGLRSMRNLEVLDLSNNNVRIVSTMPLKALNWLVELKMDDNRICKIQGSPFETMPRLRVLSIRNNRLRKIREGTFKNLRSNIAVLNVDGNPIECTCDMLWLSVWLQETNFPYPGPRCQDGRLLRNAQLKKASCSVESHLNAEVGEISATLMDTSNHLPLLNEHGDIFQRELHNNDEFSYECLGTEHDEIRANTRVPPNERPLPNESEYFYDQYVDYSPANDSTTSPKITIQTTTQSQMFTSDRPGRLPPIPTVNPNSTILYTTSLKNHPYVGTAAPASSSFTFFGYPLPSLNIGRFFNSGHLGRKNRGEITTKNKNTTTTSPKASTPPVDAPRIGGKMRLFKNSNAEFEKYLKPPQMQYRNEISDSNFFESASDESVNEERNSAFKTTFRGPSSVERGGFRPIIPGKQIGGFIPVLHPQTDTRGHVETLITTSTIRNFVPVAISAVSSKSHTAETNKSTSLALSEETHETQTYFVTEHPSEATTMAFNTPVTNSKTITISVGADAANGEHLGSAFYIDSSASNRDAGNLEAQASNFHNPALTSSLITTTTATILLIPPPEEHVEKLQQKSWLTSTPKPFTLPHNFNKTVRPPFGPGSRPPGGRSTITRVHNTPPSLYQYLPTAEEYYHTTPTISTDSVRKYTKSSVRQPQPTDYRESPLQYRKAGMDWYYDSFKESALKSSNYDKNNGMTAVYDSGGKGIVPRLNTASFLTSNCLCTVTLAGVMLSMV